jgi:hypothetical protein
MKMRRGKHNILTRVVGASCGGPLDHPPEYRSKQRIGDKYRIIGHYNVAGGRRPPLHMSGDAVFGCGRYIVAAHKMDSMNPHNPP